MILFRHYSDAYTRSFFKVIKQLRHSEAFCDVSLQVENSTFACHKVYIHQFRSLFHLCRSFNFLFACPCIIRKAVSRLHLFQLACPKNCSSPGLFLWGLINKFHKWLLFTAMFTKFGLVLFHYSCGTLVSLYTVQVEKIGS